MFARAQRGESVATIHRTDGVVVELPSFTRKHRVPHDLAHAVTEREFALAGGVFGVIAAGAMFDNMRVVSGRTRHDADARSRRILAANSRTLTLAEVVAGTLHHLVEHWDVEHWDVEHRDVEHRDRDDSSQVVPIVRRAWGSISQDPFPYPPPRVIAALDMLREQADRWTALADGEMLDFRWPDALTAPVPPVNARRRRR